MTKQEEDKILEWVNQASCLDSAMERMAMLQGRCPKPVFEENKLDNPYCKPIEE